MCPIVDGRRSPQRYARAADPGSEVRGGRRTVAARERAGLRGCQAARIPGFGAATPRGSPGRGWPGREGRQAAGWPRHEVARPQGGHAPRPRRGRARGSGGSVSRKCWCHRRRATRGNHQQLPGTQPPPGRPHPDDLAHQHLPRTERAGRRCATRAGRTNNSREHSIRTGRAPPGPGAPTTPANTAAGPAAGASAHACRPRPPPPAPARSRPLPPAPAGPRLYARLSPGYDTAWNPTRSSDSRP
jgi:hypothetical protein